MSRRAVRRVILIAVAVAMLGGFAPIPTNVAAAQAATALSPVVDPALKLLGIAPTLAVSTPSTVNASTTGLVIFTGTVKGLSAPFQVEASSGGVTLPRVTVAKSGGSFRIETGAEPGVHTYEVTLTATGKNGLTDVSRRTYTVTGPAEDATIYDPDTILVEGNKAPLAVDFVNHTATLPSSVQPLVKSVLLGGVTSATPEGWVAIVDEVSPIAGGSSLVRWHEGHLMDAFTKLNIEGVTYGYNPATGLTEQVPYGSQPDEFPPADIPDDEDPVVDDGLGSSGGGASPGGAVLGRPFQPALASPADSAPRAGCADNESLCWQIPIHDARLEMEADDDPSNLAFAEPEGDLTLRGTVSPIARVDTSWFGLRKTYTGGVDIAAAAQFDGEVSAGVAKALEDHAKIELPFRACCVTLPVTSGVAISFGLNTYLQIAVKAEASAALNFEAHPRFRAEIKGTCRASQYLNTTVVIPDGCGLDFPDKGNRSQAGLTLKSVSVTGELTAELSVIARVRVSIDKVPTLDINPELMLRKYARFATNEGISMGRQVVAKVTLDPIGPSQSLSAEIVVWERKPSLPTPAAPTLTLTTDSPPRINATWPAVPGAKEYKLIRISSDGSGSTVATVQQPTASTTAINGTNRFKVQAFRDEIQSARSNVSSIAVEANGTPNPPPEPGKIDTFIGGTFGRADSLSVPLNGRSEIAAAEGGVFAFVGNTLMFLADDGTAYPVAGNGGRPSDAQLGGPAYTVGFGASWDDNGSGARLQWDPNFAGTITTGGGPTIPGALLVADGQRAVRRISNGNVEVLGELPSALEGGYMGNASSYTGPLAVSPTAYYAVRSFRVNDEHVGGQGVRLVKIHAGTGEVTTVFNEDLDGQGSVQRISDIAWDPLHERLLIAVSVPQGNGSRVKVLAYKNGDLVELPLFLAGDDHSEDNERKDVSSVKFGSITPANGDEATKTYAYVERDGGNNYHSIAEIRDDYAVESHTTDGRYGDVAPHDDCLAALEFDDRIGAPQLRHIACEAPADNGVIAGSVSRSGRPTSLDTIAIAPNHYGSPMTFDIDPATGNMYLADMGGSILKVTPGGTITSVLTNQPRSPSLQVGETAEPDQAAIGLAVYGVDYDQTDGSLWVRTNDGGFWVAPTGNVTKVRQGNFYTLLPVGDGTAVTTNGYGGNLIVDHDGDVVHEFETTDSGGFMPNYGTCAPFLGGGFRDASGGIWVDGHFPGSNPGHCRYNPATQNFEGVGGDAPIAIGPDGEKLFARWAGNNIATWSRLTLVRPGQGETTIAGNVMAPYSGTGPTGDDIDATSVSLGYTFGPAKFMGNTVYVSVPHHGAIRRITLPAT